MMINIVYGLGQCAPAGPGWGSWCRAGRVSQPATNAPASSSSRTSPWAAGRWSNFDRRQSQFHMSSTRLLARIRPLHDPVSPLHLSRLHGAMFGRWRWAHRWALQHVHGRSGLAVVVGWWPADRGRGPWVAARSRCS